MADYMTRIARMHQHFDLAVPQAPRYLSEEERQFRIRAMQEELDEFEDSQSLTDQLDALVDLLVFTLGTAYRQGMGNVFDEAFNRVMNANMAKQLAPTAADSKRGFKSDLVKPAGWTAPDLTDLVGE